MKFSLSDLKLRDLSPDEMRNAYLGDMVYVFPANELKPCGAIYEEMLEGKFLACGLFAGEELVAYVFSACKPGYEYLFTQYVVVKRRHRAQGVGSVLMDEIAKRYGEYRAVMLDVEDPAFGADEAEKRLRRQRVRFYLKNGFRRTRVKAHVYGVDYLIMARGLSAPATDEQIFDAVSTLYDSMSQPGSFPDKYRVYLRPEERGMSRATWKRITRSRFRMARVEVEGFRGMAGVIEIDAVGEPLKVTSVLSEVTIADAGYRWLQLSPEGGGWWLTVMYDEKNKLVQYYFDVTLKNFIAKDGEPRFVDLYLDVVMDPAGRWALLDREELDAALAAGSITQAEFQTALRRAERLIKMVDGNEPHWRALCESCMEVLNARQGMK